MTSPAGWIIFILRLVVPLSVLKNPFWGWLLAMLLDGFEQELARVLFPLFGEELSIDYAFYRAQDKILDVYMSSIALYVAVSWKERLARSTSLALYAWRFVGVVLFEILQIRSLLLFFPNVYEFFFLFYAYMQNFRPAFRIQNYKRLAIILILLALPKLAQEYVLHIEEARPWVRLKYDILRWPAPPL